MNIPSSYSLGNIKNHLLQEIQAPSFVKIHLQCKEMQEMHICFPGWEIPWRREWQPTLVFLPGESHGQKSLGAPVHKVTKSRTRLKQLSMHTYLLSQFLFRSEGYFFERGGSLHGFETCLFSGLVEVVVKISHELSRNIGNRNSGILRTFESLPLLIVYWKEK